MSERKYHGNARSKADSSVIGPSKELPKSDLPTLRDVLAYIFFLCVSIIVFGEWMSVNAMKLMAKILALLQFTFIIMVVYLNSNQEAGRALNYGLYEDVAQEVIGVYARASTCLALIKIHSIIVKLKRGYERKVQSRRQSLSESKQKEFDDKLDCLF